MRRIIASFTFFAAGIGVGAFLMQPGRAQTNPVSGLRLNHVGIFVKDFDQSMRFYTQTMGFHEAFTIKNCRRQTRPRVSSDHSRYVPGARAGHRRAPGRVEPHRHLA